jgi:transcriptional regulator with XRE-family HTH domain
MRKDPYASARAALRKNRKAKGFTYKELAIKCGQRSPSSACEWESGNRTPTFAGALAIERSLGMPRVEDWGYDRKTGLRAEQTRLAAAG